jgi:Ca2+-transporting ATPase
MDETKWHEMGAQKVLNSLSSSRDGLEEKEAIKRLGIHGENILKKEKKISKLQILLNQFRSFLVVILIIAAVVSAFVLGSMVDAAVIMIIVVLNGIFGFVQEFRAEKAVEALKKLTSPMAVVIREGKRKQIPSRLLVPGDIVLLDEGTKVPADMRLLEVTNLRIDEASLTGESEPVTKNTLPIKGVPVADRKNMAYMGTLVTYGRGRAVVTGTGMKTEMGKIAHLIQEVEEEETPLQKRLGIFGKNLGILIMAICGLIVLLMLLRSGIFFGQGSLQEAVINSVILGIALAVAAIPEGLPAVVTITLALSLQRLSRRNAIIRRLPAVETLGSTSVICSDKTGTLTRNEMTVRKIYSDGRIIEVTGKGYIPQGDFLFDGRKLDPQKDRGLSLLLRAAFLCSNASLEKDSIVGDPTEGALVVAAAKAFSLEKIRKSYPRLEEFPFSSERKRMSTINRGKDGLHAYMKGAPEIVLERCTHIFRNGREEKLGKREKKSILETTHFLTLDALRVLGMAYKKVDAVGGEEETENGLVFLGLMGMIDPPRKEVKEDIKICRKAGIKTVMITGDHKNTAVAIAKELEIFGENHRALTGQELDRMGEGDLEKIVEDVSVYARVNPEHKMMIVTALQKRGHIVAMTGDGVNDAPALKKADIGVAMGIKGTDVSKEASDMILSDDNFTSIVSAVEAGRTTYDNIKKFIQYLLSSNLGEVLVILLALLVFSDPSNPAGILLPVTAIQLLWINLLTDGLPALALGVDPPSPGIMERPPRDPNENILNREMMSDIIIVGIIITAGTLFIFSINLPSGLVMAQTAAFTTLVMFEMVRVQSVRMKYRLGIFSNKKLLLAMGVSILLQLMVIYIPPLQSAMGTVALGPADWAEIISVSLLVLVVMEIKRRVWE